MRMLFLTSVAFAFVSSLGVLISSRMIFLPSLDTALLRAEWMLFFGVLFVGWLLLAVWSRPKQRASLPPRWLRGWLAVLGAFYAPMVFYFVLSL